MPARVDARQRALFAPPGDEEAAVLEKLRTMAGKLAARFRLRLATTGRLLKESSLVDTLCHELAHPRHFDHSLRFRRFHESGLAEARRLGWYKPGPAQAAPREAPLREIAR